MISEETDIHGLNGLVLAGGKSLRMGQAKDRMKWHGKEQRYHAADLLKKFCREVFISCRFDQAGEIDTDYTALPDTFLNLGPVGGILSALRSQRSKAWLVVACDLPLLNEATLQFLIRHRNPRKIATTYESPFDGKPEPLITIWEPQSYPALLQFLGKDITCPRKVLMNNPVEILQTPDTDALMNVNTPADAEKAKELLM
ncbi:MAG: NTP transferase domain-containing protein [Leadbetterella sp.]|nr:NTP transferase domain-containing protein [Leadbetterella sp.]